MSYSESQEYQDEIKEQYKKRIAVFSRQEVIDAAGKLGFFIEPDEIIEAEAGNVNATYITNEYVIKMTTQKGRGYLPNKIISDSFPNEPVVHVLAHDVFEKTPYEVLVMKKSPGVMLQDDMPDLDPEIIKDLFSQVMDVVVKYSSITSPTYGFVANPETKYASFRDFQTSRTGHYLKKIRDEKLADEASISRIENYFNNHVHILDEGIAVLVHRDLHMGNILHIDDQLTAIIDWDAALYAPLYTALPCLIGLIDSPSQFVEGTPSFEKYKDIRFPYLLPILKDRLPQVFNDKDLLLKLNLYFLVEGLMWVAGNWSEKWNTEQIQKLVTSETPDDLELLKQSYSGKFLG